MNSDILIALITGLISAVITVITVIITSEKNNALQDERIKVITDDIKKLENKVEQHNNFGLQLAEIKTRVGILEKRQ